MDEDTNAVLPASDEQTSDEERSEAPLALVYQLLDAVQRDLDNIRQLLGGGSTTGTGASLRSKAAGLSSVAEQDGARIIEGVFDGQNMVGPDSKQYSVPANYASKSKLVEGDVLKLTITRDGSFIYKQIGPVERKRIIGVLTRDETGGEFKVVANGHPYRVLLASVTYFKGEVGDDMVILVPVNGEARWAAVENTIKRGEVASETML